MLKLEGKTLVIVDDNLIQISYTVYKNIFFSKLKIYFSKEMIDLKNNNIVEDVAKIFTNKLSTFDFFNFYFTT